MAKEQIPVNQKGEGRVVGYRDEEPFVDGGIDGGGRLVVAGRDVGCGMLVDAVRGVRHREIHPKTLDSQKGREGEGEVRVDTLGRFSFAGNKTFPSLITFLDDLKCILLILTLSTKRKRILLLPIRNLPISPHSHKPAPRWGVGLPCKSSKTRWWHEEGQVNVFPRLRCR